MSQADGKRVMAIMSILERGKGKPYIERMKAQDIKLHLRSVGHGTAPSEMMDILGLGSKDKDVIISFATEEKAGQLIAQLSQNLENSIRYGGLMMVIKVSALNRLAAEVVYRSQLEDNNKEEKQLVSGEGKYNLIIITVNQGYADEVMKTAKSAGATGGTVIRGRMLGAELLKQIDDNDVQEEKEIITILSPTVISGDIMNAVNQEFGLRTDAKGVVCAVPVEKALKI